MGIETGPQPGELDYETIKTALIEYVLSGASLSEQTILSLRSPLSRQIRVEISEEFGRTMTDSQTRRYQIISKLVSKATGEESISRSGEEFFDVLEGLDPETFPSRGELSF